MMKNTYSNTSLSFELLSQSSDFLNQIINNITSCVLLLDKEMRLQSYNNALKTIFSNKPDEDLLYQYCGNAIGCAHQIEEQTECGSTTQCHHCELRQAALESYIDDRVIYKEKVKRPFLDITGQKVEKLLQFSTRLFVFNKEKFIILIVDDVTQLREN